METTAYFLGYTSWRDLIHEEDKESYIKRINLYSHSDHNALEKKELEQYEKNFLKRLFELEIPEIKSGEVEIKSIAREAGQRSKVAVYSNDELLDPIGSCIGEEGVRVKAIVNELNGEKIDIVQWSESPEEYIAASLSPSNVIDVQIITDSNNITKALVVVPDEHLSLAIGKEGQNARLAAKLTSWRIDIKSETQTKEANISYQFRFLPKR